MSTKRLNISMDCAGVESLCAYKWFNSKLYVIYLYVCVFVDGCMCTVQCMVCSKQIVFSLHLAVLLLLLLFISFYFVPPDLFNPLTEPANIQYCIRCIVLFMDCVQCEWMSAIKPIKHFTTLKVQQNSY